MHISDDPLLIIAVIVLVLALGGGGWRYRSYIPWTQNPGAPPTAPQNIVTTGEPVAGPGFDLYGVLILCLIIAAAIYLLRAL